MPKCSKCSKEVNLKGNYGKVQIFKKGKNIETGYMHEECNNEMNERKKMEKQAFQGIIDLTNRIGQAIPQETKEFTIK